MGGVCEAATGARIFASLADVEHPSRRLLRQYKHRVAPVVLASGSLTEGERQAALKQGPHRSATEHTLFIREEFSSMIEKVQWVVLPYSVAKGLPGLWPSQRGLRSRSTFTPGGLSQSPGSPLATE